MAQQQLAQRDAALEAFDRLRVRAVVAWDSVTASTFLADFQATAASLEPEERIKLAVHTPENSLELLKAVIADPQASKICALRWVYDGENDVNSIVPLLINNCPELASLWVRFSNHSAFDFVSSVLEHPSNKIKALEMSEYTKGDIPRFFAALEQSQVSALTINGCNSEELYQGLCDYLAKDLLVRLVVWDNKQVPLEMMMSLAKCTRLAELRMLECAFFWTTAFAQLPKSITNLVFYGGKFVNSFDWSFLAGSGVRELVFDSLSGVDGNQLGSALAVHLRAKGLDILSLDADSFTDETLAAVGVEIGRVKRLILERSNMNDASFALIALVLQSTNSEMKELALRYSSYTASSIKSHLVPALKHPNCNLAKLHLRAYREEHEAAAGRVNITFRNRRALFVLLQGQQVRRLYCPLRRLPVEMFRMVGEVLL